MGINLSQSKPPFGGYAGYIPQPPVTTPQTSGLQQTFSTQFAPPASFPAVSAPTSFFTPPVNQNPFNQNNQNPVADAVATRYAPIGNGQMSVVGQNLYLMG